MNQKTKKWISGFMLLLVTVACFILKFKYHELWKDEWQPWLLARDKSLPDLLQFLHLEGHPALWFSYLKPWALISNAFDLLPDQQVLLFESAHGLLFLGALFVLLFRFKMPLIFRLAMAGGFYFFYQYGVVSRGYILVILLSFLLVDLLKEKRKVNGWTALLLFLLCQTEVYGVFIGGALVLCFLVDFYQKEKTVSFWNNKTLRWNVLAALGGLAMFVLTVYPRSSHDVVGLNTDEALIDNLAHAVQGNFANAFWIGIIPDTNVFGYSAFGVLAGFLLLGLFCWFFWRDKSLLTAMLIYMLGTVLFGTFIYQGGVRHWGMNFIFFMVLTEMYYRRNEVLPKVKMALVATFLLCQLYYNVLAINKDIKYPFSNAYAAAQLIKKEIPESAVLVAINEFETAPVVAYSGRDVYTLPDGNPFTYYKWLDKIYLPSETELKVFAQYKKRTGLILLSPKPLPKDRYPNTKLWKSFENYNMKKENYYFYLLDAK